MFSVFVPCLMLMFHVLYQDIPLHLKPIAFSVGPLAVRWYGLTYIIGFIVVYFLLRIRVLKGEFPVSPPQDKLEAKISNFQPACRTGRFPISNKKNGLSVISYQLSVVLDFLLSSFFSALIGGRIGYVLFYNTKYFLANPVAIISPYDKSGALIGIFGMSYHGALIGVVVGSWFFLKKRRIDFWEWADFVVPAISLGYFFGRLGNFLNGELFGRVTDSFLGMHFLSDSGKLRHPSQLYEALLEGILLFVILWSMRKWKLPKGSLLGSYLIGYGALRIIAEQFRQPDPQIGFISGYLTLGQIFSAAMIIIGAVVIFVGFKKNKKMV